MLIPTGFWSYTTSDETNSRGKLSQLRALLAAELQQQVGRSPKVNIFQDVVAIPPGSEWDQQIRTAIADSSFIIPIVTPGFLQSEWCCREVTLFKEREETLGVRNLVFPLHYVDTDHVDGCDPHQCHDSGVLAFLRTRQWTDFRPFRMKGIDNEDVSLLLETLAKGILKALRDAGVEQQRAEARRRQEAAEAVRLAEKARRAEEEEAARFAEQLAREEAFKRLAEETQKRKDIEVAQLAEARRRREEDRAAGVAEKRRLREKTEAAGYKSVRVSRPIWPAMTAVAAVVVLGAALGAAGIAFWDSLGRHTPDIVTSAAPIIPLAAPSAPAQQKGTVLDQLRMIEQQRTAAQTGPSQATQPVGAAGPAPAEPATELQRYEQAAAGGSADAMYKLGDLYRTGRGVPQDYAKARESFEKAAAGGNASAMYSLGVLYYNGIGVLQAYDMASKWFERAAAAGNADAMTALGRHYAEGQGERQNYVRAREWFEKAAATGNSDAMYELGKLYAEGDTGTQQSFDYNFASEMGLPRDYAKAREWYEKGAAAGSPDAMKALSSLYAKGLGVPKDAQKAQEWAAKAAAATH